MPGPVAVTLTACLAACLAAAAPPLPPAHPAGPNTTPGTAMAGRYQAPVTPMSVVRAFDPPKTRYGPGHLGVDLAAPAGRVVLAAAAGVVRFAGQVAGRGVVVLAHADGITTEYEPVLPLVVRGRPVRSGQPIGRVAGRHDGCVASCLHWGARRADHYLDPLTLLQALAPVRLLPWPA